MIDITKQYTYKGRPVRIYADGSDTYHNNIHIAYFDEDEWVSHSCSEYSLVEVWQPKEGEWCFFWSGTVNGITISKFKHLFLQRFIDEDNNCWENCAAFNGTLPKAFKGVMTKFGVIG